MNGVVTRNVLGVAILKTPRGNDDTFVVVLLTVVNGRHIAVRMDGGLARMLPAFATNLGRIARSCVVHSSQITISFSVSSEMKLVSATPRLFHFSTELYFLLTGKTTHAHFVRRERVQVDERSSCIYIPNLFCHPCLRFVFVPLGYNRRCFELTNVVVE